MELLLLSNSTNYKEDYLSWCSDLVNEYLDGRKEIVFIPYAGVSISHEEYEQKVNEGLAKYNTKVKSIHHYSDAKDAIQNADAIVIGGGNTFVLLKSLYENGLIDLIKQKVKNGARFVGWSAGSNVAGLGINTSNDMPIQYPPSFDALGLAPFMINPHFTDKTIPNHGGETRTQRLEEFMLVDSRPILTMEESSGILIDNKTYKKVGLTDVKILQKDKDAKSVLLNELYNII